ncbi:hypothetical protein SpiGrapes_2530 [Sphaerochaeta pleomorpha str. Grapes]|uniref:DUF1468 domain-containing protein n=1 Tax=Sphaerochaeta pleomorpha (strain ATCC BAA-1885 / DSM 22778 / Grapes) TaxID=158190 RepID=G8QU44_SPHPG|nr:tripartite tricarboxylate transporter TctB family protein [Sphaerochaeta pleomorpha]AEV30291.1 hypothetical protein SpiGrapes_2530 [Sphaerochaeta pleomorpha str. Grapes]
MKVRSNLVSGIIFMVLGAALLLLMKSQVIVYGDVPFIESAKVIPFFVEVIMLVCGAILVIQSLFLKKETYVDICWAEQKYALMIIGIFAVFATLIYFAGFIVGAIGFIVMMAFFFRDKNIVHILILAVLAILIYLLFTRVFNISLPGFGEVR